MPKSNLPQASVTQRNFKLGTTVIKPEKPTQSFAEAQKALNNLEKAAQQKVFISNESYN